MNPIIVPSPLQSALLQARTPQLAAPGDVVLTDLSDPAAMEVHFNNAVTYIRQCDSITDATRSDYENALKFEAAVVATQVLSNIPAIINPAHQVGVQNNLNQMNARVNNLTLASTIHKFNTRVRIAKGYNASATMSARDLQPPPHLNVPAGQTLAQVIAARVAAGQPAFSDPAMHAPALPTNVNVLLSLTGQALADVENYYGLPHEGSDEDRRNAVKVRYGIRIRL